MNNHLLRAQVLLEQNRPELAAQELRQELMRNSDDLLAHALLAHCLARQKQFAEATREAERAVHLAPDLAYAHYVLASVLDDQDRLKEAEAAVQEAIRLEPTTPIISPCWQVFGSSSGSGSPRCTRLKRGFAGTRSR